MLSENLHLLIVGSGSVGQRHAENLSELGCLISCFDPRDDRISELKDKVEVQGSFLDFDEALASSVFGGVVICSPPKFHVDQAMSSLALGLPVLMEKPVGPDLVGAKQLLNELTRNPDKGEKLLLGYTWRWWEALMKIKQLLRDDEIGSVYHAQFFMSAHLADWHPWEPYQDFFMSSKELGGGALLDESHWIDQMIWYFGLPDDISATIDKVSDLEITSDDSVEILASYEEGLKVFIHLDIYGRPHEKSIKIIGSEGKIEWDESTNEVFHYKGMELEEKYAFSNQRNDMFLGVAKSFLEMVGGGDAVCSLQSGVDVLRVVEATRLSSLEKRRVSLQEIT